MLNLTKGLPDFVEHCGVRYEIRSDFKVWLKIEKIMSDNTLVPTQKAVEMLALCYVRKLPPDFGVAMRLLSEFYCGGKKSDPKKQRESVNAKRLYDFEHDAELIYAAFMQAYGIDLAQDSLHWWKFLALFRALPEGSRLTEAIRWRAVDISDITDKGLKAFYRKMKQLYRLPDLRPVEDADGELAEVISKIML